MKIFIQKDINKLHEHITQKGLQSKPIEIVTNQNIASILKYGNLQFRTIKYVIGFEPLDEIALKNFANDTWIKRPYIYIGERNAFYEKILYKDLAVNYNQVGWVVNEKKDCLKENTSPMPVINTLQESLRETRELRKYHIF